MDMVKMVAPFSVKAVDTGERTFEGYANTWELDLGDDIVHPGAFTDSLKEWRESKQAMPLLNSHNYFDIMSGVGQMLDAEEDKKGLWTKWEVIDGQDGDGVLARIRPSKRTGKSVIGSMSIGYQPMKYDYEESEKAQSGQIRNLYKVGLRETSLVLFPMNTGSLIDVASVKSFMAGHDVPDDVLAGLKLALPELQDAAEAVEGKGGLDWDTPGNTPLDLLRLQRLRSRSQALKSGIITHAQR